MAVSVLFFGATADIVGTRKIEIELQGNSGAAKVFDELIVRYPRLSTHRLHYSINQKYATGDEVVHDGDELAIFTAVSGG